MTSPIDKRRQLAMEECSRVANNVLSALKEVKPTVTEHEFVNHYLPILTARNLRNAEGEVVPVDMNHWFNVSGSPFAAVDVVDNAGNVLFEVPPVNRSPGVKFRTRGNLSFQVAAELYPKISEMNPHGSLEYLTNEYFARNGHVDVKEDMLAWISILRRYNLLHTLTGESVIATTDAQAPEANGGFNSVDTEYEDF